MSDRFYDGQVVFDKKRTDPTDDLLVVVDSDVGPLRDLDDDETRRLVKHNETNKKLNGGDPVSNLEPMIRVAYIQNEDDEIPTLGEKTYTFPEFRLETVQVSGRTALDGYQPHQWALISFLGEMVSALEEGQFTIEDVEDLQVLCMEASIDGEVITEGTEHGLRKITPTDS